MDQPTAAISEVYAGFWLRVWAAVIDTVLIALITYPIMLSVYGWEYFQSPKLIEGPLDFLVSWVLPTIGIISFWIFKLATPGKMAIGARIVDARTGGRPSNAQFIGRYFAYFLSMLPLGLGFIWVGFDARKQGWHDKLANTVVVRKPSIRSKVATYERAA